jgi:hypothetical protein
LTISTYNNTFRSDPRDDQLENLLNLFTCGYVQPFRQKTTLQFARRTQTISLDENAPGYKVPGVEYCFVDISRDPVLILERDIRNTAFRTYRDGKCGGAVYSGAEAQDGRLLVL